eukprot:CAMPEP_0202715988 /NCGR_PEP_ID=MMETSP1385-20130828/96005_1 /ASSEMBLY_ACC=CAM_ASM_000861 /TAXON_ID=933848 /ORGANISM="Elphidium margaritaceum" /LENGTH=61 /DNA_ID=CAMNT_0049377511 /DNA_START=1 /DNA_END=183 /DNA_ORIENTATION=+
MSMLLVSAVATVVAMWFGERRNALVVNELAGLNDVLAASGLNGAKNIEIAPSAMSGVKAAP